MRGIARVLLVLGGGGVAASAFLPWLTVEAPSLKLDLLDTVLADAGQRVEGTETAAWPGVVAVGVLVGVLALLNVARKLLALLGLLVTLAGGALLYYGANVVDIETGRETLEGVLAGAALSSSPEFGAFLLPLSGVVILLGAMLR